METVALIGVLAYLSVHVASEPARGRCMLGVAVITAVRLFFVWRPLL